MRRHRWLIGLLAMTMTMLSTLLAPVAWADGAAGAVAPVTESPANTPTGAVALAHTGLDITVPMMVGLAVLLAGTALVAWAVLRGSRSRGSHS
jgi:hypothetical protein